MNEENLNLNSNQISDGENESPIIPSSPEPKIDLRTLNSDLEQIQQTGGQNISGYQPTNQNNNQTIPNKEEQEQQVSTSANNLESSPMPAPTPKKKTGLKFLIFVLIIALILIGYFVLYPKIFNNQKNQSTQNNQLENLIPPPPQIPTEQLQNENLTSTPTTPETSSNETSSEAKQENIENKPTTLNLEVIENYQSFSKRPNTLNELILNHATLTDFKNLFTKEEATKPILKEIVIKNIENKILSAGSILSLIDPIFFNSTTLNYFEKNFNLFKYTNNDGQWLIFVLKLKKEANVKNAQDNMINLQKSDNLSNYFLEDVGLKKDWQDGKVKNKPTSLVNFEKTGATLSYTWFDSYLLLSTNLEGAENVATLLGY